MNAPNSRNTRKRRKWLRFSLGTMFVVVTIVCLGIGWWLEYGPHVTATIRVRRNPVRIQLTDRPGENVSAEEYQQYKQTQLALLKSPFVINAALRSPGVSRLTILDGPADPTKWITKQLKVDSAENSEGVVLRMRARNTDEAALLLNAVVQAYLNEIVHGERSRALMSLESLREQHRRTIREMDDLMKVEYELENVHSVDVRTERIKMELRHLAKQREQVESMLLETDIDIATQESTNESDRVKTLEVRHSVLQKQLEKIVSGIDDQYLKRDEIRSSSAEIRTRRDELESHRKFAEKLRAAIAMAELELAQQPQVQLIQKATAN